MKRLLLTLCLLTSFLAEPVYSADVRATYPKLKAGEWKVTVNSEALSTGLLAGLIKDTEILCCIDAPSQNDMINGTLREGNCKAPKIISKGIVFHAETSCESDGRRTDVRTDLRLVSDEQISGTTFVQSGNLPEIELVSNARYLGACRGGRTPGSYKIIQSDSGIDLSSIPDLKDIIAEALR